MNTKINNVFFSHLNDQPGNWKKRNGKNPKNHQIFVFLPNLKKLSHWQTDNTGNWQEHAVKESG